MPVTNYPQKLKCVKNAVDFVDLAHSGCAKPAMSWAFGADTGLVSAPCRFVDFHTFPQVALSKIDKSIFRLSIFRLSILAGVSGNE